MMSLASATYASVNAVYARLAWALGIKNVARTATRMGITTPLPNVASIALGSVNCTPYEMASAYGTLATGGVHYPATVITKVVDRRGQSIFQVQPKGTQVLKPSIAAAATDVLQGVIGQGTGSRAGIGRPAAGKTGTSQLNRDAWFVGYTPQLVTAVWVGYPIERTIVVDGSKGFGGTLAAPIWASFMKQALAGQTARNFPGAPPPPYDTSKFDIPVSDQTRMGRTVTVSVYSDRPRGTVLDKSTSGYVTTITISKGPKPNTPAKPVKPVKKPVKPKPSEPTSPTP
jgi:membrane peptidoglycan carboxypeptidase